MYFKFLIIIGFLFLTSLSGAEDVEVLAKNVDRDGDIVHAKDDVVLYSEQYVITADEAFYNTTNGDLELLGNITILDGIEFSSRSGKADLNLNDKTGRLVPLFAYIGESDLWLQCAEGTFDTKFYKTKKAITSSCEVQDPDWKIGFSTGTLDKENKFMHLYNSLFYIKDIPVFYLPYFSFPTDQTRRSGLLRPEFAYGDSEGFYYLQPIFYAGAKNWDLELDPQIRTHRGYGLNATLRFVDSKYSQGEVQLGQFNEQDDYAQENSLNDKHYGFSLYYDRSNLFSDLSNSSTEDGLYIDFQHLNDIDYLTTQDNEDTSYSSLVTSKLNYYFKRDEDYVGVYAKYYIDTDEESNSGTAQEIPTIHYHKFLDTFLKDNLYYSIDYNVRNYTRSEGYTALENEIIAPISFHYSLIDDYLSFKFSETFSLTRAEYGNISDSDNLDANYGQYITNYHTFSLYTELSKPYEDFYHTFYLGVDYILPGSSKKDGYFDDDEDEQLFSITEVEENVSLDLVEYFYNSAGEKKVAHSIRQAYYFSDYTYKYGDLENYIKLFINDNLTLSNTINYSHEYSQTSKVQTTVNLSLDDYTLALTHTHENDGDEGETTDFLSVSASTDYTKNYNFFATSKYNFEENYSNSWSIGVKYRTKCWDYILTYKEEITPTSGDIVRSRGIYLIFNLTQIGGVNYDFVTKSDDE